MRKEHDLIYEIGPRNWIDSLAGEAVILGEFGNDPELVVMGTQLANLVANIAYDSDRFHLVQTAAINLRKTLEKWKKERRGTIYIDEIYEGKKRNRPSDRWEFDLVCLEGRYRIYMILPIYTEQTLNDEEKMEAEMTVRSYFDDPTFDSYRKEEEIVRYDNQQFKYIRFFNEEGKLTKRIIDFDHEGAWNKGWTEIYYFDDFTTATKAWADMKDVVTLNRKK